MKRILAERIQGKLTNAQKNKLRQVTTKDFSFISQQKQFLTRLLLVPLPLYLSSLSLLCTNWEKFQAPYRVVAGASSSCTTREGWLVIARLDPLGTWWAATSWKPSCTTSQLTGLAGGVWPTAWSNTPLWHTAISWGTMTSIGFRSLRKW